MSGCGCLPGRIPHRPGRTTQCCSCPQLLGFQACLEFGGVGRDDELPLLQQSGALPVPVPGTVGDVREGRDHHPVDEAAGCCCPYPLPPGPRAGGLVERPCVGDGTAGRVDPAPVVRVGGEVVEDQVLDAPQRRHRVSAIAGHGPTAGCRRVRRSAVACGRQVRQRQPTGATAEDGHAQARAWADLSVRSQDGASCSGTSVALGLRGGRCRCPCLFLTGRPTLQLWWIECSQVQLWLQKGVFGAQQGEAV